MISQSLPVQLSIASPADIERTAGQLLAIRDRFRDTERTAPDALRPLILESWRRCQALHVDPLLRYAPAAIARDVQLRERWEANALLMQAAEPVMRYLADMLAESGYVVALADATGCILRLVGDRIVRRRLARIDFLPGGGWGEAQAGTNAIGTALTDGHPVQLMAAEHFCDGWQDLTCTAVPIHDALTRGVIGVLDVTGDYRLIRSPLVSLLAAAALEVENGLRPTPQVGPVNPRVTRLLRAEGTGPPLLLPGSVLEAKPSAVTCAETDAPDALVVTRLEDLQARDAVYLVAAGGAVGASLDVQATLEHVAEQAAHLLRLDRAAAGLFNLKQDHNAIYVWHRHKPPAIEREHTWEEILGHSRAVDLLQERGEPVIVEDAASSDLVSATLLDQLEIRSLMLLPLTGARGVAGFIVAPRRGASHWSIDDVRLGLTLAAQAATAIENARLFDSLQRHARRIEALNAIAALLSALQDPSRHLETIVDRIAEILGLSAGLVLLRDEAAGRLTLAAYRGLPASLIEELRAHPVPLQESYVMQTGESMLIRDAATDERILYEPFRRARLHEVMVVPLAAGGARLGILQVACGSDRTFTDDDLSLFTAIGQQLGLALENEQRARAARDVEALREADRLKSAFLAMISHDLRSPLTAIHASIEGLLDGESLQALPLQEQLLQNIAGQTARLGRLVDQVLDLSRIEAGVLPLDRDWVEVPSLIDDAVAAALGDDATRPVERHVPSTMPLLYVDYDRMFQVLFNLLENARKYAPPGSPIAVEAEHTSSAVLIGVADRGPGIPAAEHEAVFQHFYRLRGTAPAAPSGSGLGLAICRGIVEAHGGTIWVEDRPGGGSIFRFSLPLPESSPAEGGAAH